MTGKPYDLRRAAGLPIRFIATDDQEYSLPSDPPVEIVARMLTLERAMRDEISDIELTEAIVEGKRLLVSLARQFDPTVEDIPLGVGEVLMLFGLVTGGESVAQEIADALTAGAGPLDEEEAARRLEEGDDDDGAEGSRAPLASRSRSTRRAAASKSGTAGRRTAPGG